MPDPSADSQPVDGSWAWLMVVGAFGANFVTFGTLFSFGVFLTPIADDFSTTTGPVAGVFSATVAVYYLAGAVGGMAAGRLGIRPIVLIGSALFAVGLVGSARVGGVGWLYPTFALPVGIGIGGCYSPLVGAVGGWFERRRTLAIAVVLTGVGSGTLVMPLVSRLLIDRFGWRDALTTIGLGAAVVLAGAVVVSRTPPRPRGAVAFSPRAMVGDRLFRRLYLSVLLVSPAFYAPLAFINDYAIDRGIGAGLAASLVSVIGGSSLIARVVFGAIGDRIGAVRQYRASYVGMGAAIVVWLVSGGSFSLLVMAAVLHGVGWAAWVTAGPVVLAEAFGVSDLGGVLGTYYTALGFGGLAGPAISGYLIDGPGYRAAILFALASGVSATMVLFVPRFSPSPRWGPGGSGAG